MSDPANEILNGVLPLIDELGSAIKAHYSKISQHPVLPSPEAVQNVGAAADSVSPPEPEISQENPKREEPKVDPATPPMSALDKLKNLHSKWGSVKSKKLKPPTGKTSVKPPQGNGKESDTVVSRVNSSWRSLWWPTVKKTQLQNGNASEFIKDRWKNIQSNEHSLHNYNIVKETTEYLSSIILSETHDLEIDNIINDFKSKLKNKLGELIKKFMPRKPVKEVPPKLSDSADVEPDFSKHKDAYKGIADKLGDSVDDLEKEIV